MTYTNIIADAMKIGTLPTPPTPLPSGSRCSYTGEEIGKGYAHEGGVISEPTARLLLAVDFRGVVVITDEERAKEAVAKGIGRGKAWGCGMVVLT